MLTNVLLAAALIAATPTPAPAPPLTEIGHIKATSACAEIATHANSAISSALQNNLLVGQTILSLRKVDLDSDGLSRHRGLQALIKFAKDLRAQAMAGAEAIKHLRQVASHTTDPAQKKELTAFADSLGGAIGRQKKVALNINGMIAAFDFHDMERTTGGPEASRTMPSSVSTQQDPRVLERDRINSLERFDPLVPSHTIVAGNSDTREAQNAATDFEQSLALITNDEKTAADHVAAAFGNC